MDFIFIIVVILILFGLFIWSVRGIKKFGVDNRYIKRPINESEIYSIYGYYPYHLKHQPHSWFDNDQYVDDCEKGCLNNYNFNLNKDELNDCILKCN